MNKKVVEGCRAHAENVRAGEYAIRTRERIRNQRSINNLFEFVGRGLGRQTRRLDS